MKWMSNKYLEVTTRSAFAESSFIPVLVEPCEELISRDTSQQWLNSITTIDTILHHLANQDHLNNNLPLNRAPGGVGDVSEGEAAL